MKHPAWVFVYKYPRLKEGLKYYQIPDLPLIDPITLIPDAYYYWCSRWYSRRTVKKVVPGSDRYQFSTALLPDHLVPKELKTLVLILTG